MTQGKIDSAGKTMLTGSTGATTKSQTSGTSSTVAGAQTPSKTKNTEAEDVIGQQRPHQSLTKRPIVHPSRGLANPITSSRTMSPAFGHSSQPNKASTAETSHPLSQQRTAQASPFPHSANSEAREQPTSAAGRSVASPHRGMPLLPSFSDRKSADGVEQATLPTERSMGVKATQKPPQGTGQPSALTAQETTKPDRQQKQAYVPPHRRGAGNQKASSHSGAESKEDSESNTQPEHTAQQNFIGAYVLPHKQESKAMNSLSLNTLQRPLTQQPSKQSTITSHFGEVKRVPSRPSVYYAPAQALAPISEGQRPKSFASRWCSKPKMGLAFKEHGHEFGIGSERDLVDFSYRFWQKPISPDVEEKLMPNGRLIRLERSTGTVAVADVILNTNNEAGSLTIFKPTPPGITVYDISPSEQLTEALRYFTRQ